MNTLIDSILSINLVIFETPCWTIKINQNNVQSNITTKRSPFKASKNIPYILYVIALSIYFLPVPILTFSEKSHTYPNVLEQVIIILCSKLKN